MRRKNGEGRERTLHRDNLLPVGFLPATHQPRSDSVPKPRKRKVIVEPVLKDTTGKDEVESVNSDFSEINVLAVPNDSVGVSERAAIEVVSNSKMSGDDRASAEPESVASGDDDHILQHSAEESSAEEHFDVDVQEDVGSEASGELIVFDVLGIQPEPKLERPPRPKPRFRRSTGNKQQPKWQASGYFVMCQNTTQPDWQHKSRLLQQLARCCL